MVNEKTNQALNTYINNSIELRRSSLEFLKDVAIKNWETICTLKKSNSLTKVCIRFCFNGDMWLLDSTNANHLIWVIQDFWIWKYNSDLLNLMGVIARNSGLCSCVTPINTTEHYGEIEITFK